MSLCTATLKSNKDCSYRAKYELVEHNQYYCKRHALAHSNELLGANYSDLDDVPNLLLLDGVARIVPNDITTILEEIRNIFGMALTTISQEEKTGSRTNVYVGDSLNMLEPQYILKVVKQITMINKYSNGASMYASIHQHLEEPMCVPIISVEIDNQLYLVRGSKYVTWYYELTRPTYPLLGTNNKKLILRLAKLIELSQKNRIVHGSISLRNLSQLSKKRISSTVFTSLRDSMFWVDKYGNTVEATATIDSTFAIDQLTCARSLHQKNYPSRHDDYESLLYLSQYLEHKRLPWIGLTNKDDLVQAKNQYLGELLCSETEGIRNIVQIILNSHFDDRPKYSDLYSEFENML